MKNIFSALLIFTFAGICSGEEKPALEITAAKMEAAAAREVKQTNTHIHDIGRRGGISFAQFSKAADGKMPMPVNPAIKTIKRIAVAGFAGNIKARGEKKKAGSGGGAGFDNGTVTIETEKLVVDTDFKKAVLTGMYVAYSKRIAAATGWVIIHPKEIISNKFYSGLDYGEVPSKKLFGLFGPSYNASWQGATVPGFKYITPPVFEWGTWVGTDEQTTALGGLTRISFTGKGQFKSADFDKFSDMIGRLTKELGVDAVFTVQTEIAVLPASSGWSLELDGVAANLWDSNGTVLWSGKVEKDIAGEIK